MMPKNPLPQFGMDMTDDAVVTLYGDPTTGAPVPFHDEGYMPVNQVTLSGTKLQLAPGLDHFFISYHGDGVQTLSSDHPGAVAAYDSKGLQFDLIGYKGPNASFSVVDGKPTLSGAHNLTVLGHGQAVGALDISFDQLGAVAGITGTADGSAQIGATNMAVHIAVNHDRGDVRSFMDSTGHPSLALTGGTLEATFTPIIAA
jgi:hypothetical protein